MSTDLTKFVNLWNFVKSDKSDEISPNLLRIEITWLVVPQKVDQFGESDESDEISLRPGSYVAFLPCRIQRLKFDVWIGCRISAARSTGLVALSDRNATPIQTSNFCRVESNSYIMLMYWACVNLVPSKRKKKLGYSRPNATLKYCKTNCCTVSLHLLVPLADNFSQN